MCGVIGYIGKKKASPVLVTALKRMEYRGYDSAGIATIERDGKARVTKRKGAVSHIETLAPEHNGTIGIGHTRWATHGAPTDENAHPHTQGRVTLIHNGIFENYAEYKHRLKDTYTFHSQTDSEVLAALIDSLYTAGVQPIEAVKTALRGVRGTFGLIVLFEDQADTLIVAKRSSPILIAKDGDSVFIASDQYALAGRASQAIVLGDDEVASCSSLQIDIESIGNDLGTTTQETIELSQDAVEHTKQGFSHFMHKEILEQPESLKRVLAGRLNHTRGSSQLGGLNLTPKQLRGIRSLLFVGCGTAYNAGLTAKYLLEPIIKIPIQVEVASELRYRNVALSGQELAIAISQSGETADTIACIDELQLKGIPTLGVINVVGSTISRMVDGGVYTHAGPEIAVASTKAFTSQLTALLLIGLYMARQRSMTLAEGEHYTKILESLPALTAEVLKIEPEIKKYAKNLAGAPFIMTLGRDTLYPIAIETALKIKEITYIPTYAEAAGEMKHGPIALIHKDMGLVYLLGDNVLYEKSVSNLTEAVARGVRPTILTDSNTPMDGMVIRLPKAPDLLRPFVFAVAGQLLSYHIARVLGTEIDKPRNLAKSVTVE